MVDQVDVLVAGSGVAGLSAAVFASRHGRRTLVVTGETLGGHLLSVGSVEDFIGFPKPLPGYDVCPAIQEQASAAGAEFLPASVLRMECTADGLRVETDQGDVAARSVILASGSHLRSLGIPGESRLRGKGVSDCASCDGPLFRGKTAAVVGDGDSALQESLELAQHVERVILLARGASLSGQQSYAQRVLENPRIEVRYDTIVDEIVGNDAVEAVRLRGARDGAPALLDVSAAFVFVGLEPRTSYLDGFLELDDDGKVPTDDRLRTGVRGVLAAGDIRSGSAGQAASAAGDGVSAAVAADRFLRDGQWPSPFQIWRRDGA